MPYAIQGLGRRAIVRCGGGPRLDLRQDLGERAARNLRVVIGLHAQPPAVREAEEPAQARLLIKEKPCSL
jgi:hypothetical protein